MSLKFQRRPALRPETLVRRTCGLQIGEKLEDKTLASVTLVVPEKLHVSVRQCPGWANPLGGLFRLEAGIRVERAPQYATEVSRALPPML